MRFVPKAVMIGYINALAVLIFLAQLPQLSTVPPTVYVLTILSLGIIYILPRLTKAVPSPLVALAVMTIAAIASNLSARKPLPGIRISIGDGAIPSFCHHANARCLTRKSLNQGVYWVGVGFAISSR